MMNKLRIVILWIALIGIILGVVVSIGLFLLGVLTRSVPPSQELTWQNIFSSDNVMRGVVFICIGAALTGLIYAFKWLWRRSRKLKRKPAKPGPDPSFD